MFKNNLDIIRFICYLKPTSKGIQHGSAKEIGQYSVPYTQGSNIFNKHIIFKLRYFTVTYDICEQCPGYANP